MLLLAVVAFVDFAPESCFAADAFSLSVVLGADLVSLSFCCAAADFGASDLDVAGAPVGSPPSFASAEGSSSLAGSATPSSAFSAVVGAVHVRQQKFVSR